MNKRSWRYMLVLLTIWLLILAYMGWYLFVLEGDSTRNQAVLDRKERHVELLKTQNQKLKQIVSDMQTQKDSLELQVNTKEKKLQKLKQIVSDMQSQKDGLELQVNTKEKRLQSLEQIGQQRKLVEERRKARAEQSPQHVAVAGSKSAYPPSSEHEHIRRRASNEARELFYYLSAEITKINKNAKPPVKKQLIHMLTMTESLHHMLTNDMEKLHELDGAKNWQWKEHEELSRIVQQRLKKLQNPKDCASAKKLVCQLNKGCGYGCQMHHVLYCFIVAFGMKRTLIIDSTNWRYSSKGWDGVFQLPSDTCVSYRGSLTNWGNNNNYKNILLPIVDSLHPRPLYMPMAVPEDLSTRMSKLHGHPFVWWIGQFAKYLFQYNPQVQSEIDDKKKRMGFKSPIVGIQVRRTDKINTEAAFHSVEEYMYWVKLYYKRLAMKQTIDHKRVFVASDDPTVFPELEKRYKGFDFISDVSISKSAGLGSRYSDKSLHGVIFDIQMLSECDYLVCTFSSQVCRLAYEMMQARHPDASKYFQSLDDVYYFGGQSGHNLRAILPHTAENEEEIDLEVGDLIGIAGNHWDGYSKGTNQRTGLMGIYPSWKVEEVMDTAVFPTYDDD